MNHFSLRGDYRVQSRRDYAPSALEGEWYCDHGLVSNEQINGALRRHPRWAGHTQVSLLPVLVSRRSGKFASEPDILYKRDLFIPEPGADGMPADIVDVLKSQQNWLSRAHYIKALFPDDFPRIFQYLCHLELIIANEYMLHEAGHFLAYDVFAKQRDGYFSIAGKTAWPLVYLEELRADLNAFGFAVQLLPQEQAAQIFLYNLMLRFGVHREGLLSARQAPYGLVPYLLFYLLYQLDFIAVRELRGRYCFTLGSLDSQNLIEVMQACALHAEQQLNTPEMAVRSPLDRAIAAARYVRLRLDHHTLTQRFASVMNQQAASKEQS
ncbi:MAG TPA: hypothetical protein VLS47_05305 [Gallionella sp.]|nr:hypothetical protein [Gallionella sp.]